jgi:hypothetical protein
MLALAPWQRLESGERGGDKSREKGVWCWVWARCNAFIVIFIVAIEVGLLVDIDMVHLQWLTLRKKYQERLRTDSEEETYGGGGFSLISGGGRWMFIS